MSSDLKTQGCPDSSIHAGHEWQAVVRNRRHDAQDRWCPGRVKCDRCGKHVFTSTATTDRNRIWVCMRRCR